MVQLIEKPSQKNAIRVHIKRPQCVDMAFSGEVMSISAWKRS